MTLRIVVFGFQAVDKRRDQAGLSALGIEIKLPRVPREQQRKQHQHYYPHIARRAVADGQQVSHRHGGDDVGRKAQQHHADFAQAHLAIQAGPRELE